jgi:hypothetical protein
MKIEIFYFEGCPNYRPAADRLRTILRTGGMPAEVSEIEVKDESAATALKFIGSPTIRVNGLDIEAASRNVSKTGLACRCYPGGLPSEQMIRMALRQAQEHDTGRSRNTGAAVAGIAAIGSVLAASSCCLPILPFVVAAGFAGGSAFLSAARPYLLGASILFIAFGFYQARRAKKCQRRRGVIGSVLLWVSAVFVFLSTFFPQLMANAAANLLAR